MKKHNVLPSAPKEGKRFKGRQKEMVWTLNENQSEKTPGGRAPPMAHDQFPGSKIDSNIIWFIPILSIY